MYTDQLEEKIIDFDDIFLDPNNPRFWSENSSREIPDKKVVEDPVQEKALTQISKYGVDDLLQSILRNGFLPLDRIVVRELEDHEGRYVVVEGNRRTAALRTLRKQIADEFIDEPDLDEEYMTTLVDKTNKIEVLVYRGDEHDVAWVLQGVRHIGGIKDWGPAQRGRLVADRIDNHGLKFKEAGQQFGLSAQAVGRLYRTYKALEQMKNDDEFQSKAKNEYFSLFEEAIRDSNVKKWMGWSDDSKEFLNQDERQQFYAWIIPDDEHDNIRRLHDPRHVRKLGFLLGEERNDLISKVDTYELEIEAAYDRASQAQQSIDWESALDQASGLIESIPHTAISSAPEEFKARLQQLQKCIGDALTMAEAIGASS